MEVAVAGSLLGSISEFCRRTGMAESTFGRRAVNDGKFVSRLRDGARVTPETLHRVNQFMVKHGASGAGDSPPELLPLIRASTAPAMPQALQPREAPPEKNFRFFDNRQKYLLFVNTCSEKDVVASRVGLELGHIHPRPPAVRLFDAGMGDGTVLARVMREMHRRFPTVPFYIVGKEISLEDVRLSLRKMVDRFYEHPATVLVVTNMYYTEAPWLTPRTVPAATSMVWHEAALAGTTAHDFAEQIAALEPFLAKNWQARHSPKTGNPIYEHPVVLVIYRDDYRFLLDEAIPKRGEGKADYDMIIASPPYRARAPPEFKAQKVVAPLVRALVAMLPEGPLYYPPGQRSEETRERILRAARRRFSHAGYARTSLGDIAREAGLTPRAIYHYVDSKPELFTQSAQVAFAREHGARGAEIDEQRRAVAAQVDVAGLDVEVQQLVRVHLAQPIQQAGEGIPDPGLLQHAAARAGQRPSGPVDAVQQIRQLGWDLECRARVHAHVRMPLLLELVGDPLSRGSDPV